MIQENDFNMNYLESVNFLIALKDLPLILMNMVSNHHSLGHDASVIIMKSFAYMLPSCDTENLLKIYDGIGQILKIRYNCKEFPSLSNDCIIQYIKTICSFNESIVTNWRNQLDNCPQDLSQSIINLLNVVKDKNSNK